MPTLIRLSLRLLTTAGLAAVTTASLAAGLLCSDIATADPPPPRQPPRQPPRGTLHVNVSGFEHNRGHVIAKLFRRGDDVPKGAGYRRLVRPIQKRRATLAFSNLSHGSYALFLFHDENDNATVDHNLLGFPSEPLGFSGGFKVSLVSGMPDFDDLRFEFSAKTPPLRIVVE